MTWCHLYYYSTICVAITPCFDYVTTNNPYQWSHFCSLNIAFSFNPAHFSAKFRLVLLFMAYNRSNMNYIIYVIAKLVHHLLVVIYDSMYCTHGLLKRLSYITLFAFIHWMLWITQILTLFYWYDTPHIVQAPVVV